MMKGRFLAILPLVAIACGGESTAAKPAKDDVAEQQPTTTTTTTTTTTSSADSFPMQAWMKANATVAMSGQDHARLEEVFGRINAIGPTDNPEFTNWKSLSSAGADAAKKHDLEGVRAACKGCHDTYRSPYKAKLRTRALPRAGS